MGLKLLRPINCSYTTLFQTILSIGSTTLSKFFFFKEVCVSDTSFSRVKYAKNASRSAVLKNTENKLKLNFLAKNNYSNVKNFHISLYLKAAMFV